MAVISNDSKHWIYPAGLAIPPGGVREIDDKLLGRVSAPVPAPAEPDVIDVDWVDSLRQQSVAVIKAQIPALTQDELSSLHMLEQDQDAPRSSLLAELDAELLRRAIPPDAE